MGFTKHKQKIEIFLKNMSISLKMLKMLQKVLALAMLLVTVVHGGVQCPICDKWFSNPEYPYHASTHGVRSRRRLPSTTERLIDAEAANAAVFETTEPAVARDRRRLTSTERLERLAVLQAEIQHLIEDEQHSDV